ncbi:hypothetical protein IMSAG013_00514 [Clostridiales bacterium]|jgi:hypothetical protein|nr:DUF4854 domain-containing protein [Clostridiales bacterium]GFI55470.1 hypothetical protein IMSAG013_00514 [Clostridiales bacterium]
MKKILAFSMVLLLCSMCIFVGCSSKDSNALAEYAEEQQKALDAAAIDGMTIKCTARDNSLVFSYSYESDLITKDNAQTALDSMESQYATMLSSVQTAVPSCESIIIEILDKDGNVMADTEYKK